MTRRRVSEWVSLIAGNAVITVKIKETEVEDRVRVRDFESWLDGTNKSPRCDDSKGSGSAIAQRVRFP